MNKQQPLFSSHLNELYTYEIKLQNVLPELIGNTEDPDLLAALQDLYSLTSSNYERLDHLGDLMQTEYKQQKSQAAKEIIKELQKKTNRHIATAEQTELLALLHKYLGQMFTDYTYAINLVEDTGDSRQDAIKLLNESIKELKECNNRLSQIAEKKIAQLKQARQEEVAAIPQHEAQEERQTQTPPEPDPNQPSLFDKARDGLSDLGERIFK